MSNFPENEKLENETESIDEVNTVDNHDEADEFTTIFSDPTQHNDRVRDSKKNRIISIIGACLAVVVLVVGTVSIIKLIPELEQDESTASAFEDITVLDYDSNKLSAVTVENSNGKFRFYAEQSDDTTSSDDSTDESDVTTPIWRAEGLDVTKVSNTTIDSIVSAAASITAVNEVTSKTAADCGLDNPVYKVTVSSDVYEEYTILVGGASPDGMGLYLMIEGKDNIYIVDENKLSVFDFNLLDLANKTSMAVQSFSFDTSNYKGQNDQYLIFDSIVLSGTKFPNAITITSNQESKEDDAIVPYIIKTPMERYANADYVSSVIALFSNETVVNGIYAYDITDETLAQVGLDNPDVHATLTIKGESKNFKISAVDDSYCAVINDESTMIYKVALSNFEFMGYKTEDFYSPWVSMNPVQNITDFDFVTADESYEFDIVYDDSEDAEQKYVISCNGENIDESYFRSFYQGFVGLNCSEFTVSDVSAQPYATFRMTFTDGTKSELVFYKVSEAAYQYTDNGRAMGKVTSAAFNKVIKNLKLVAQGKEPTS